MVDIRRFVTAALALVATLALAACGGDGDEPRAETPPGERTKITLAYFDDPSRDCVLYAIREGIVTSESIELEFTFLPLQTAIEAFQQKKYDVVESSPVSVPRAGDAGLDALILSAGLQSTDGTFLLVRADSGIETPADLAGKTVGVASLSGTFTIETRYVLEKKYGLDADPESGNVRFVEAPLDALAAMLRGGDVDAAVFIRGPLYALKDDPELRILSHVTQEFAALAGSSVMSSVMLTYADRVENKGEALAEARRMLAESEVYFREHQAEVIAAVAGRRQVSAAYLSWWWEAQTFEHGSLGEEQIDAIQTTWDAAVEIGALEEAPPISDVLASIER